MVYDCKANNNRKQIEVKDKETGETKIEYDSGRLTPTRHCIAYPIGSNMWETYLTSSDKLLTYDTVESLKLYHCLSKRFLQ